MRLLGLVGLVHSFEPFQSCKLSLFISRNRERVNRLEGRTSPFGPLRQSGLLRAIASTHNRHSTGSRNRPNLATYGHSIRYPSTETLRTKYLTYWISRLCANCAISPDIFTPALPGNQPARTGLGIAGSQPTHGVPQPRWLARSRPRGVANDLRTVSAADAAAGRIGDQERRTRDPPE